MHPAAFALMIWKNVGGFKAELLANEHDQLATRDADWVAS